MLDKIKRILKAVEETSPCCPTCGRTFDEHRRGCEFQFMKTFVSGTIPKYACPRCGQRHDVMNIDCGACGYTGPTKLNPDLLEEASRRG